MRVFHFRKTEKMLGKEHPYTLTSMDNLAGVLSRQAKYEEAEEMHRQELAYLLLSSASRGEAATTSKFSLLLFCR